MLPPPPPPLRGLAAQHLLSVREEYLDVDAFSVRNEKTVALAFVNDGVDTVSLQMNHLKPIFQFDLLTS